MSREILTIQLGHYSNYVGSHWWNLQVRVVRSNVKDQLFQHKPLSFRLRLHILYITCVFGM